MERAMEGPLKTIRFSLNGKEVELNGPSSQASLNDWIRAQPGLTGTKKMCDEGGCGCCVVSLTKTDLLTKKQVTIAVNSCLCPLYSINGCSVTTVEGIGR
ncbi:PREDICTED: xanthine dehydrogenase-like [Amphimedon queenslandica]|uniref:2Fe-2S ferredoxin-type domain-containing protein n=1 Tax=Amphimedon queenslandica TaxID=400682 RepID=A0AAN0JHI7_AMPQE|nr:PREDICTED: xanthine dehydrogenase-like [Amphimedon queenslandica]|eukprot:XP_019856495.1 PREDICTED: xanthine dehydrogenase-like [Amphimedon queenslandica]